MKERRQCEFFLLRYVPDAVKEEFVNVGVVLLESSGGWADVRFTKDWKRVRCLDPDADVEMLEGLEQEIKRADAGGREQPGMAAEADGRHVLECDPADSGQGGAGGFAAGGAGTAGGDVSGAGEKRRTHGERKDADLPDDARRI